MKINDYLRIAYKDSLRQPLRTLLTITAITISSALFVALISLGIETRSSLITYLTKNKDENSLLISANKVIDTGIFGNSIQLSNDGSQKLRNEVVDDLKKLPGVELITPVVNMWWLKDLQLNGAGQAYVSKAAAIDPSYAKSMSLSFGNGFADTEAAEVIVSYSFAKSLTNNEPQKLIGQQLIFTTQVGYKGLGANIPKLTASKTEQANFAKSSTAITAKVVGITGQNNNDNQIYLPLGWADKIQSQQHWSNGELVADSALQKDGFSNILIKATDEKAVKELTRTIDQKGFGVLSHQKQVDQVNQLSTVLWLILGSIAVISFISAALGVINTLIVSVNEQREIISIWRACGAKKTLISGLVITESMTYGLVGGLLGSALGYLVSFYVNGLVVNNLKAQGLELITIHPASGTLIIASILITTLLSVIASLQPARSAAKKIYL